MDLIILISGFLLLISLLYYIFPPKKINLFYGYRTKKSMKNIENWRQSNRIAGLGMILISIFNLIVFYSMSFFIEEMNEYILLLIIVIEFGILIYITEKKLSQNEI